jgi:fatty acid desaturase
MYYLALSCSPLFAMPAAFLAGHAVAIAHNHAHLPLFRFRWLNLLMDFVLQATVGIPQLFWERHHLHRHHRGPWTEVDWSSPYSFDGAASPERPVSRAYFCWTYLPLFLCESLVEVLRRRRRRELGRLLLSALAVVAVAIALCSAFGPWRWLFVFGMSYVLCGKELGWLNYLQHWACYRGDGRHWAWTFTCRLHNLLTYNSGYHLLHHLRPTLHWSQLPAAHRADPSYTHPELIETGLFPGYRGRCGCRHWLDEKWALQEKALAQTPAEGNPGPHALAV